MYNYVENWIQSTRYRAQCMKSEYEGEVVWNGRKYLVRPEDCYGYADKNWGNGIGTVQLYDRRGALVDRIHAENIGCEYGEYVDQ